MNISAKKRKSSINNLKQKLNTDFESAFIHQNLDRYGRRTYEYAFLL